MSPAVLFVLLLLSFVYARAIAAALFAGVIVLLAIASVDILMGAGLISHHLGV